MRVKKYKARNIKEALVQIKQDFGSDAVILHSRPIVEGGVFGFFGKEMVEVTAGLEINIVEDQKPIADFIPTLKKKPVVTRSALVPRQGLDIKSQVPAIPVAGADDKKIDKISERMNKLESRMVSISDSMAVVVNNIKALSMKNFNNNLVGIFDYLMHCGIKESIASEMLSKIEEEMMGKDIKDPAKVKYFIRTELSNIINTSGPVEIKKDSQQIISFIGSTGVGKTTTIAKLAANFALMQKKKVALITVDTYRIAAIEQLKTYASIIGVPIDVVFTPEEFKQILASHKDKDIILIDTAGRSPKNSQQMKELKQFLDAGGPGIEKYLVLSVTSKNEDIEDTIKRFDIIKSENVIFTKLDETSSYGVIVNVLHGTDKKVSYITTGQNVPDDLEVADRIELIDRIMGQAELVV